MRFRKLIFVGICCAGLACVAAGVGSPRVCTNPYGKVLYRVAGERVTDASGNLLGTVSSSGEVRLPNGSLVALHGDAGILAPR